MTKQANNIIYTTFMFLRSLYCWHSLMKTEVKVPTFSRVQEGWVAVTS